MKDLELIMTRTKYIVVGVFIVLGLVILHKYITNPWLWHDEAGQFWISKGLGHQSPPISSPGGLWQVIVSNQSHNSDPGGFSVLLHFWLMISNNYIFIRILPLLFFFGFVYFFYKYLLALTNNAFFSFFCATLLFLLPLTVSRMVEIRAYSMELMGITWAMLLLHRCEKNNYSPKSLMFLSLCMALFCTSRWDYVIFAFVIGIYTFIKVIKTKTLIWKKLVVFCLPLLISVLCVIFITFLNQYQNPYLHKLDYLAYMSDDPSVFYHRLFLLFLFNTGVVLISFYKKRTFTQLQTISLMVPTMFVILSLMGKYPWDKVRTIAVVIILILNLTNEVYHIVNLKKRTYLADYIRIPLVMIIWHFIYGFVSYPGGDRLPEYDSFKYAVNHKESKVMYVDWWFSPSLRYMYEYGPYKDRAQTDDYPGSFRFQELIDVQTREKTAVLPRQTDAEIFMLHHDEYGEDISILNLSNVYPWVFIK